MVCGSHNELRRSSSFERMWEENGTDSAANDIIPQANSLNLPSKNGPLNPTTENKHVTNDAARNRAKDSKSARAGRLSHEQKKVAKSQDEKRTRTRKLMEFHNIKISQVVIFPTI